MSNAAFAVEEHVGHVIIEREEALNAIDSPTKADIIETLKDWRAGDEVRVVVIGSEGDRAFCAGGDLKEVRELDYSLKAFTDTWEELFEVLTTMGAPTIARVDGYALGGGFDLMLHCDLVVAADDAMLGQPEVGLGIVNHFSPPMLLQAVGLRRTMELLLTGEMLSGAEAAAIGLVTRSVPRDELDDAVDSLVESLLAKSPRIVAKVKRGIYTSLDLSPSAARAYLEAVALESARVDPDYREGVAAQLEGREPNWATTD